MTCVVKYCPEVEKQHFDFASRYWKKRKRITPAYLYWKFRGTPKDPPALLLAKIDEKVVGQLGLIPCLLLLGSQKIEAQWACELMVDKEYRGQGIAKQLYDFAYTLNPVTLGSDPSPAAAVSMKRAGFSSLAGPSKFLFPLYLGEITKLKGFESRILDSLPNPFLLLFRAWHFLRRKTSFEEIDRNTYVTEAREIPKRMGYPARIDHSGDFAEWRFNSFLNYYTGVTAYRDEKGSMYSEYRGSDLTIVTEHHGRTSSSLMDLLSDSIVRARLNGFRKLKILAHNRTQMTLMTLLGFIPFRTPTEIIFRCEDPAIKEEMSKCSFYYTYLDSDENI